MINEPWSGGNGVTKLVQERDSQQWLISMISSIDYCQLAVKNSARNRLFMWKVIRKCEICGLYVESYPKGAKYVNHIFLERNMWKYVLYVDANSV